jgi:hypothetical protein
MGLFVSFQTNGKEFAVQDSWKNRCLRVLLLICIVWSTDRAFGATETVFLPITLEYPFIRSVLVRQLYKATGERAIVIDEAQEDCVHIELWDPEVSRERSMIRLGSRIKIRAGAPILGNCVGSFEWEGYIEALQRLVLDKKSWQTRFETIDSRVYDAGRKPETIAGKFWNLIKTHVHPYLDQTSIELLPPLKEMKTILPLVFPPEQRRRVDLWLDTMKLGPLQVEDSGVKVNILLDVEISAKPRVPAAELSRYEIERLSRVWEDWDAFLVFEIESLIGQPINDAEQRNLLEMLLENRHEFFQALDDGTISTDLVRRQFIRTWQRLAQILRKHLVNQKSLSSFGYLAFFAASDALVVLDKLGPTLGLEISRDGLIRLARLLSAEVTDPILSYSYSLDPGLRKFLGLGPPLDESGPASEVQELELLDEPEKNSRNDDRQSWFGRFLFPRAWAKAPSMLDQVRQWIPPARDPNHYIGKVRNLLEGAADTLLIADPLAGDHSSFFHRLLLATAWQESCWRQFIVQEGKLRYLISYNRSSVGLMQINERVWRGLYRVESLRWNIGYNIKAGTEILNLYLRTFALKEISPKTPADLDTIARATYAMYNGGPGQLKKFMGRKRGNALYKSDYLFLEKYTAAKAESFDQLGLCISGN